jgi:hypothetical protein
MTIKFNDRELIARSVANKTRREEQEERLRDEKVQQWLAEQLASPTLEFPLVVTLEGLPDTHGLVWKHLLLLVGYPHCLVVRSQGGRVMVDYDRPEPPPPLPDWGDIFSGAAVVFMVVLYMWLQVWEPQGALIAFGRVVQHLDEGIVWVSRLVDQGIVWALRHMAQGIVPCVVELVNWMLTPLQ